MLHCASNQRDSSGLDAAFDMKVYDLMMQLAQYSPYAEVGAVWDGAAADVEFVQADSAGVVLLMADDYASLDIRLEKKVPDWGMGNHE